MQRIKQYSKVSINLIDKDAKVAIACKIASICLSLLKNNSVYQDDFKDQQMRRIEINKKLNLEQAV